ncbi:UNVERIFIED_CONTAM: UDP-D-apiose/UDP-D-xylose synthase 2 [Sesamum indicum]
MANGRVDLDGNPIKPITICMIGAGGFIGSHLCEKLMSETPHKVLAVDVYDDKIKHLLEPSSLPWADRIQFHRINIKNDSRLEGLIRMADLVIFRTLLALNFRISVNEFGFRLCLNSDLDL